MAVAVAVCVAVCVLVPANWNGLKEVVIEAWVQFGRVVREEYHGPAKAEARFAKQSQDVNGGHRVSQDGRAVAEAQVTIVEEKEG